ncbi:importin 13 [Trichophyton equinum CBS 127.97]|uniref:Importin 13 n=1 Tax=Trichophyton equinum (strain ATCC MYA-4606 / CBS 127.97) TaxID=559882 RepID=F2PRP5_TRIEC|nr:importin 13 [Trichophyton equinum CBS 127.97]
MDQPDGSTMQQADIDALIFEARQLATDLTTPGLASQVATIQDRLLKLQKSSAGWMIADGFLGCEDPKIRFYGPLTLTMKINQEWDILNVEQRLGLLAQLMNCFVMLIDSAEKPLVMRKFFSTLTTFFFKPGSPWTYSVRHVTVTLANGKYLPEDKSEEPTLAIHALSALSHERLVALLSFCTALAEESTRYLTEGTESGNRLQANTNDVFHLIDYGFERAVNNAGSVSNQNVTDHSLDVAKESIQTLHAWLQAFHNGKINPPGLAEKVKKPLGFAAHFFGIEALALPAMELFAETIANQYKLVGKDHMDALINFIVGPGERYAIALMNGEYDDESMKFLDLLLRFSALDQSNIIINGPSDENREKILFLLYKLFHAPGYPQVDDCALARVITEGYDKLRFPSHEVSETWDDNELRLFVYFRREFAEYLLEVYPLLGVDVIRHILEQASNSIAKNDWEGFEVAIYCLGSLAESVAENEHADSLLDDLFCSEVFQSVCFGHKEIPLKVRQTMADMIDHYTLYFARNGKLLAPVLNFLFSSLDFPSCDPVASRSISSLCQSCRKFLPMHSQGFIDKFHQLCTKSSLGDSTLERVAEGIAAVIQAAELDRERAVALLKLLNPLLREAQAACQQASNGQYEEGLARSLIVMRCIASIGRGIRAPDDDVIDLDTHDSQPASDSFWANDPLGVSVTETVICILDTLVGQFPNESYMIEATCDVLKAGYTERHPGPYVLPTQVTVRFVKATNISSPRFSNVMATATAFLASRSSTPLVIEQEVTELTLHTATLIQTLTVSANSYDPEAAHSCIDFLTRLIPRYYVQFFNLQYVDTTPPPLPAILSFTLDVLKRPDPLPLRASCSFWAAILSLTDLPSGLISTGASMGSPRPNEPPGFLDPYLRVLGEYVMHQIAGNCARSDLDHFCEVIKKFVFKHQGAARHYFGNGLVSLNVPPKAPAPDTGAIQSLPAPSVTQQDLQKFLSTIISLRGARQTNANVKNFWVSNRGKGFAYV